jgi:alkanesulfonate monooxygenase SsuD/methylene tetrahydromethanopterin reductase-like flavin-dependent oxidoreductase (luciferase family)
MIAFGITDHVEGPREAASREVYDRIIAQTRLADDLGFEYAWFAEHHAHAHAGHLPAPLLLALHLVPLTHRIQLGTAIICLNLHHPLSVAEQTATADLLSGGRLAVGFGSGSTPEEFVLFGLPVTPEAERHARFAAALELIRAAWRGSVTRDIGEPFGVPPHAPLPVALPDIADRAWLAVNSVGAARIAGSMGFNMLFSHLRTPAEYCAYRTAYQSAGGRGRIAANRPIFVARDEPTAWRQVEPGLRTLWRRFHSEGKIATGIREPADAKDLCAHPINFIVGSPDGVARQLAELHEQAPYDVANLEVRWTGLSDDAITESMRLLAGEVRPRLDRIIPA